MTQRGHFPPRQLPVESKHVVCGYAPVSVIWLLYGRSYPQFLFLEQALKSGQLPPAADFLVQPVTDTFAGSGPGGLDATEAFALGMTGANAGGCVMAACLAQAPGCVLCAHTLLHVQGPSSGLDLPCSGSLQGEQTAGSGLMSQAH
jgi:hypothetical protein